MNLSRRSPILNCNLDWTKNVRMHRITITQILTTSLNPIRNLRTLQSFIVSWKPFPDTVKEFSLNLIGTKRSNSCRKVSMYWRHQLLVWVILKQHLQSMWIQTISATRSQRQTYLPKCNPPLSIVSLLQPRNSNSQLRNQIGEGIPRREMGEMPVYPNLHRRNVMTNPIP